MAVVDGLSTEEVATRLDADLAKEKVGYSMSAEEALLFWAGCRRWVCMATAVR